MNYFTSDTHFGDTRLDLFHRDMLGLSPNQMDILIISKLSKLTKNDTLYHLGDVALSEQSLLYINNIKCKKVLIRGNYDQEDKINQDLLNECFSEIYDELDITIQGINFYLNHYPSKCKEDKFNLTGHIHGLWRVQRNMINVGCDIWHFEPVSEDKIIFTHTAIKKYYDENVFAGELKCNNNI